MRFAVLAICLVAAPAHAEFLLSEVTGNWAGKSQQGFYFRAVLSQEGDAARLRIWQDIAGVPEGGDPQLDNAEIALAAFTTLQELRLRETDAGMVLTVFTGFADETGSGREWVNIRYMDNQFTVVGYQLELDAAVGAPWSCEVDLLLGYRTVNNAGSGFARPAFADLNAGTWFAGAAFDDGYCPLVEA
ncbi:MAG: hypothetical protein MUD11_07825 [Rhodobacteraceae bacterium]|jgi:hypothetical protein|nr:hypothetical protein [Paracoccaceae bacterium]